MYKKHKFIKNIKKAWYKIKLIDRCLIIVMAILMFQSIYNLFVNEVNSQDTTTIDVVVRTTSAAIFGYFLSANFIKRPLRKYTNTDVSSNLFIDNNLSPKGQESNQNNIMNVKIPLDLLQKLIIMKRKYLLIIMKVLKKEKLVNCKLL